MITIVPVHDYDGRIYAIAYKYGGQPLYCSEVYDTEGDALRAARIWCQMRGFPSNQLDSQSWQSNRSETQAKTSPPLKPDAQAPAPINKALRTIAEMRQAIRRLN